MATARLSPLRPTTSPRKPTSTTNRKPTLPTITTKSPRAKTTRFQSTATFGASTVNDGAQTDCDANSLSGVNYNDLYGQSENINNPNVYDNFCKGIDGTMNGYWFADSHGNKISDPVSVATTPRRSIVRSILRRLLRRTPPLDATDQSTSAFTVGLTWTKGDAGDGCGQTVESCRAAFAKLAGSPCGHQGGRRNSMTTEAKITLSQCGAYSYKFVVKNGGGGGDQASAKPQPAKPSPDMKSKPCEACETTLGASDCKAQDLTCLQD